MLETYSKLRQNVNKMPRITSPSLRIGQLAELSEVDAATLRTWESRYGVPVPERTEGGQRRYPATEVERVRAMRRMIEAGYRASEAARVVASTWAGAPASALPVSRDDVASLLTEGQIEGLDMLDRLANAVPLEDVIIDFLIPVLQEIGDRWETGVMTVAEEHAASALVASWLGAQLRALPRPLHGSLVTTATPAGERHELGVIMLGLFLRRQGIPVLHLGSDLPAVDLARMVERRSPALLCLGVSSSQASQGLREVFDILPQRRPDLAIRVGGAWSAEASIPDDSRLPTDMREAAAKVIEDLEKA
jgi:DNA-binding transcriptional MerR regulator